MSEAIKQTLGAFEKQTFVGSGTTLGSGTSVVYTAPVTGLSPGLIGVKVWANAYNPLGRSLSIDVSVTSGTSTLTTVGPSDFTTAGPGGASLVTGDLLRFADRTVMVGVGAVTPTSLTLASVWADADVVSRPCLHTYRSILYFESAFVQDEITGIFYEAVTASPTGYQTECGNITVQGVSGGIEVTADTQATATSHGASNSETTTWDVFVEVVGTKPTYSTWP